MNWFDFLTGSYREFDKEGSGVAEMNITQVSFGQKKERFSSLKKTLNSVYVFFSLTVALCDHVWMKPLPIGEYQTKVPLTQEPRRPPEP